VIVSRRHHYPSSSSVISDSVVQQHVVIDATGQRQRRSVDDAGQRHRETVDWSSMLTVGRLREATLASRGRFCQPAMSSRLVLTLKYFGTGPASL